MKLRLLTPVSTLLCSVFAGVSVNAANIAWISFHNSDSPSTAAASAGFTQAPDIGYTSLLAANGHTVTRFLTVNDITPAAVATLNTFDLVIIGRSVDSTHYQAAAETAAYNTGITAPLIDMSGYTLRGSRLGFTTGETIPDIAGSIQLKVNQPHPIFAGIPLDGFSGLTFNTFAGVVSASTNGTQRGISVNTSPIDGGGTVLATVGGPTNDPAFGGMIIGEWQAGSVINGGTETLGGRRLVFLSGSRESSTLGTSQGAGVFDLTADGQKMFLNAVTYMVPEPSTMVLTAMGGLAGVGLLLRRRK
jgi:hypothetical protein